MTSIYATLGSSCNTPIAYPPMIHLPARHMSQTHKFPKRCINLVLHAILWTQKITTK